MTGFAWIGGLALDDDLQPAVAAAGAGLTFARFYFAQKVILLRRYTVVSVTQKTPGGMANPMR